MQAMQRSLAALARHQRALLAAGQRGYAAAAAELAVAEPRDSPFLRFASPVPEPIAFDPILSTLPRTDVSSLGPYLTFAL